MLSCLQDLYAYSLPRSSNTSTFQTIWEFGDPLAWVSSFSVACTSSFRLSIFLSEAICLSRSDEPRVVIIVGAWGGCLPLAMAVVSCIDVGSSALTVSA